MSETVKKGKRKTDFFKNIAIRHRIYMAFFLIAVVSTLSIGWLGYSHFYQTMEAATYARLTALKEGKKRAVEYYFEEVRKQIAVLSENQLMVGAAKEFLEVRQQLDSMNFPQDTVQMRRKQLIEYYEDEMTAQFDQKVVADSMIAYLERAADATVLLQWEYLLANPNGIFQKDFLDIPQADDHFLDTYNNVHYTYHPSIRNFIQQFNFQDVILVDSNSGDVLYSAKKFADFGVSLFDDPFRGYTLSKAFLKGAAGEIYISDFHNYEVAWGRPMIFLSAPVYDEGREVAVLIFQLPYEPLNDIMKQVEGFGDTGESYLVGNDFKMRSNNRYYEENREAFESLLENEVGEDSKIITDIKKYHTVVLSQDMKTAPVRMGLAGDDSVMTYNNYLEKEVLSAFSPFTAYGKNWVIIAEISKMEALAPVYKFRWYMFFAAGFIVLMTIILGRNFAYKLLKPLFDVRGAITNLAKGSRISSIAVERDDELGQTIEATNALIARSKRIAQFAKSIEQGKYDVGGVKVLGEQDLLGTSLIRMRDKLKSVAEEERIQLWMSEGISKFAEILRVHNSDRFEMLEKIMEELIDRVGAGQGGIFLVDDEDKNVLKLKTCYAYNRKKYLNQTIEYGQGIIGRCWSEGETIHMDDIPENYLKFQVGLGKGSPKSILLVPIRFNNDVLGVIELASLRTFKEYEIQLCDRIAENLGSAISGVISNENTTRLLKETQMLANELAQREEEMRQNAEELQATQEEMNKRQSILENEVNRLKLVIQTKEEELQELRKKNVL